MAEKVDKTWKQLAVHWDLVRPPLRPSVREIAMYQNIAHNVLRECKMPRVVLLGVTPELLLMRWPEDTFIIAVEQNVGMIDHVYRSAQPHIREDVHARVVHANWQELASSMTISPAHVDLVIGDGCFTQLTFEEYPVVAKAIADVLGPKGRFVHRFFLQDEKSEVHELLGDLDEPYRVDNWSLFKLALLKSLARGAGTVRVEAAYRAYMDWLQARSSLPPPQHCTVQEINSLTYYAGSERVYTFPGREEVKTLLAPLTFERFCGDDMAVYSRGEA